MSSDGVLQFSPDGDPTHFLYMPKDSSGDTIVYSQTRQEVLIRLMVTADKSGDGARAGPSVMIPANGQPSNIGIGAENYNRGVDLLFRNNGGTDNGHTFRLHSGRDGGWGPHSETDAWEVGQWYWMRLLFDETGIHASYWQDGHADPGQWLLFWDKPNVAGGWAGIQPPYNDVTCDVDYILILAAGLETITVNAPHEVSIPEPATIVLLTLSGLAMLRRQK